jgi:exodeoxyribonuclease-3
VVRIGSWNVNSLKARQERVEAWLDHVRPDVLCLQETKVADDAFPALAFSSLGYEAVAHGQGRWNGVAILSRVGIADVVDGFGTGRCPGDEARLLTATCGGVRVTTLYAPNGRLVGSDHYTAKLEWLARLPGHLEAVADPAADVLVCGDFNVAPDDRDVWDPAKCNGGTHVSRPEREALAEVCRWGLTDVFRARYDEDRLFTWWDYRAGAFHKHEGMRIDLLLASAPLARRLDWILVDRNARKGKLPSDHAPVVAEFAPAA